MNWYVIFYNDGSIYRKAKFKDGTPIDGFINAVCYAEIDDDFWFIVGEDDYEAFLKDHHLEEDDCILYFDLT